MDIYGLKNCDTCRKAAKALPSARFVDLRADGLPEALLLRAIERFENDIVNRRSTTWRGLNADERAQAPLALLQAHPALMKRPLIVSGDQMYLGWGAETQETLGV